MKSFKKIGGVAMAAILAGTILFGGCNGDGGNGGDTSGATYTNVTTVTKEISKEEYVNKTLGGLLGQFAGFLSGYEFVWRTANEAYLGMPESWFEFLNGPYAGNYEHFTPSQMYAYDRLKVNSETGRNEVYSDDDFHIDIFNQLILDEYGSSSYAIKNAWKDYSVSDWGGGADAMWLINSKEMLAPFTGTIEAGNRFGWCTEAYIENETLGMNAPGMPNLATLLVDKFASNVGYFDPVLWGKYYATLYSLAYFETDIKVAMNKAKNVLPVGSYPRVMHDLAWRLYEEGKTYVEAAQEVHNNRRMLYRLDNYQTDPNVNGAFAVLSLLYGNNSYLDTCKYASILGYDGDCTAAIVTGMIGVLKGFKEGNEEYNALNNTLYYNGEGVYRNVRDESFEARIRGENYPTSQKIDDIVALYQSNFEKLLVENGGQVLEDKYVIQTTDVYADHSYLFNNYDAEERTTDGYESKNGTLDAVVASDASETGKAHTGYAAIKFTNSSQGEVYHKFENLKKGKNYRVSVFVRTSEDAQVSLFARNGSDKQEISFFDISSSESGVYKLINKAFTFTANSSKMDVGFSFDAGAKAGDYVVFDDFMLEEIEREELALVSDQALKLVANKYLKTVTRPEGVKDGEEVVISVQYRNYSGGAIHCSVLRNNVKFGGVVCSSTSRSAANGYAYLEIPYVFEKGSDAIALDFDGYRMYIGEIKVYRQTQYMFR